MKVECPLLQACITGIIKPDKNEVTDNICVLCGSYVGIFEKNKTKQRQRQKQKQKQKQNKTKPSIMFYCIKHLSYVCHLQASIIAIIVPDEEELPKFAKKEGLEGDFKELCKKKVSPESKP